MNNHIFTEHLIELRKRLLYTIIGFAICALILFPFSNPIYHFVAEPIAKYLPTNTQLIATDIISPFFVPIKLVSLIAVFISLPNTVYQLWRFIAPGLYQQEKKLLAVIVTSSILFFAIGVAFCYFLVLPAIFHFIANFKLEQITMMTDIEKYLNFILSLFMVFGIAFEMPVIILILIRVGILSVTKARQIRKYVFVGCFIIAAIVTPPDILSQTMLAIPLYILYELGIIFSLITQSKPAKVQN